MTDDAVLMGVVIGGTIFGPSFMSILIGWQLARRERRDRERQAEVARAVTRVAEDAARVAKKASSDAADLLEAQKKVGQKVDVVAQQAVTAAEVLVESQSKVAAVALAAVQETGAQLKAIHAFVNSDKTTQMQSLLGQARLTLSLLGHIVDVATKTGQPVSQEYEDAIPKTIAQIKELEYALAERAVAQQATDDAAARG